MTRRPGSKVVVIVSVLVLVAAVLPGIMAGAGGSKAQAPATPSPDRWSLLAEDLESAVRQIGELRRALDEQSTTISGLRQAINEQSTAMASLGSRVAVLESRAALAWKPGNNGTVSCDDYCRNPQDSGRPAYRGCVGALLAGDSNRWRDCHATPGLGPGLHCLCASN